MTAMARRSRCRRSGSSTIRRPASRCKAMPNCGSRGFRKRFLMTSPKATQSLYLLIAAVSVETGKPYSEAQYLIEQSWDKMEALKPNVLSIFENASTVMQVAQGQADLAGLTFSKSVYPYTVKGAPIDMCYPEGGHLCRHQLPDPGQGRDRTANSASPSSTACSIRRCSRGWPRRRSPRRPSPAWSSSRMSPNTWPIPKTRWTRWPSSARDWTFINPIRPKLLEKYNQVFGA